MKLIRLLLLIVLLVSAVYLLIVHVYSPIETNPSNEDFFLGVTFGGKTTSEAKLLIDKVKGFTNLFVINSWDLCARANETALNEICEYAASANLNFMVFFDFIYWNYTRQIRNYTPSTWSDLGLTPWHVPWLNAAKERWGDKFLGVYLYDEPGGRQVDKGYWKWTTNDFHNITSWRTGEWLYGGVSNYSDAASRFVRSISRSGSLQHVTNTSIPGAAKTRMPVFTSDYALYWFDYLAGYDAVFAQLGWTHNATQHIALCRGAANVQNKQWGVIITWAKDHWPYLKSGADMSKDLLTAYRAGAKYLVVFNYPLINPYGALTEEHFAVIETFWNQTHPFPGSTFGEVEAEVAFVLPKDYGWGMREPDDKIWGLWPPDDSSPVILENMNKLIERYGLRLDIIYDDPRFDFEEKYSKIYYWNSTIDFSGWPVSSMQLLSEFYGVPVIAIIAIICVPAFFLIKRRKQRAPEAVFVGSEVKASLRNLGSGRLELVGNTLKFHTEKGYLKKRKELAREVPLTDIESVERVGNEIRITWKGATDIFTIEKRGAVGIICERITEACKHHRFKPTLRWRYLPK